MKSSKLVKIVLVMIISLSMILIASQVFADTDLTNTLTGNSTTNNTITITGNNTINTTNNTTANNTTNNVVLTTNNTSTYNNTSLPNTGIGDSIPGVILVVVLGISAVYAYKKMQDYKNI